VCICVIFFLYLENLVELHTCSHIHREREREFIFIFSKIKPTHRVNIKPHNMACVSPRVFWNIVRHCQVSMLFFFIHHYFPVLFYISCFFLYLACLLEHCASLPGFDVIVIFFLAFYFISRCLLEHFASLPGFNVIFIFFYSSLLSYFILLLAFYFISRVSFGTLCVTARFLWFAVQALGIRD
jgi:hypothetical protein